MGVKAATVERQQPFRDARGPGAIVFDPARLRQAEPAQLEPGHYGAGAQAVQAGGRGAAWFVRGEFGDAVLRQYRRGGLAARLSRESYLWLGEPQVRSLAEFRLLLEMRAAGLPVPAPLLAGYWRHGAAYRAAILVERIPGARALADWLGPGADQAPWEAIGRMIGRFHGAGIEHADLNAHNVLVDGEGRPWLIDFDRSRRHGRAGRWRQANLERLARSLAKLSPGDASWKPGYDRLLKAWRQTSGESAA